MSVLSPGLKAVYDKLIDILTNEAEFSYFNRVERGFNISTFNPETLNHRDFPRTFVEDSRSPGGVTPHRTSGVFETKVTFPICFYTFLDRGRFSESVFNPNKGNAGNSQNVNPGIDDILTDIESVFYDRFKRNHLTLPDVFDWDFTYFGTVRLAYPELRAMEQLALVKGKQVDITLAIRGAIDL